MCRIVMFALLTTILITAVILLRGMPLYYYVGVSLLAVAVGMGYGITENWFELRQVSINPGHFNEVADRSDCLAYMINQVLLTLPTIQQNFIWKEEVRIAIARLLHIADEASKQGNKDFMTLDRASWFFEMVNELLIENQVVAGDLEALKHATAAGDHLWKLYKHLGEKGYENGS